MRLIGAILIVVVFVLRIPPTTAQQQPEVTFIAAGVPTYVVDGRDYDRAFEQLADAGITVFFPTFQYQEIPDPRSLGYETDFLPPCSSEDPAFVAMRAHNIRLLAPGQLLYPPGQPMPSDENDPLLALLECAGYEGVVGVLSIDEPFGAIRDPENPYQDVAALYERVKTVAPELPVLMVHAPVPAVVGGESITPALIDYYLGEVAVFSQYADAVGFDVYPIPSEVADVTTPYQGGAQVDHATTVAEYIQWLQMLDKPYFMALQAFSYDRLYADTTAAIRPPTEAELRDMVCITVQEGALAVVWWGQSFLTEDDAPLWESVLRVSSNVVVDYAGYCR